MSANPMRCTPVRGRRLRRAFAMRPPILTGEGATRILHGRWSRRHARTTAGTPRAHDGHGDRALCGSCGHHCAHRHPQLSAGKAARGQIWPQSLCPREHERAHSCAQAHLPCSHSMLHATRMSERAVESLPSSVRPRAESDRQPDLRSRLGAPRTERRRPLHRGA